MFVVLPLDTILGAVPMQHCAEMLAGIWDTPRTHRQCRAALQSQGSRHDRRGRRSIDHNSVMAVQCAPIDQHTCYGCRSHILATTTVTWHR
jgi:hypothetical protein